VPRQDCGRRLPHCQHAAAREMYCDALASCGATATLVNNQTTTTAESNCAVSCAAMLAYGFKPDSA